MPSSGHTMNRSHLLDHIEKPGMHLFVLSAAWSVSIPGSTSYKSEPCPCPTHVVLTGRWELQQHELKKVSELS